MRTKVRTNFCCSLLKPTGNYNILYLLALLVMLLSWEVKSQTMHNLYFNSNSNVVRLDFTTSPPLPYATGIAGSYEAVAHYENSEGDILFWFNSNGVYNQNGTFMSGSFGILANPSSAEICVCPVSGSTNQYYILYNTETCSNLYYSIVDMTLNGGLGDVVSLNTLISSSNFAEGMEVVPIPQTDDYWFLTYQCDVGFTKFLISASGIGPAQVFHPYPMPLGGYDGRCEFDYHLGRIGIGFAWSSQVFLADFDPLNGEICNPFTLSSPAFNNNPYGIDFSPTANKMYFSLWYTTGVPNVFQYDFATGIYTGFQPPLGGSGWISGLGQIELGRDGKLYIIEDGGTNIIVINNPDDDVPVFSLLPIPSTTGLGISDQIQFSYSNSTNNIADTLCTFAGNIITLAPTIEGSYWFAISSSPNDTIGIGNSLSILAQNIPITYIAKPIASNCFILPNQYQWTIVPTPLISVTNNGLTCIGETTVLLCSVIPSANNTYNWSGPNGFSSSQQNPIISINGTSSGTYTVSVTNSLGCSSLASTYISVTQLPNISISPNQSVCSGQTVTLSASGGINYLWSTGATTTSITVSPFATTLYSVTVSGSTGCTSSAFTTVSVNDLPVADAGSNYTICSGQSVDLTATGGSYYQWSNLQNSSTITVSPQNTTQYTVTVTNEFGCTNSTQVVVMVNPTDLAINGPYTSEPLITCYNDTSYSLSFYITGGNTPYTINGIPTLTNNTQIYTTNLLSNPYYNLTIADNSGCTYILEGTAAFCGFNCNVLANLDILTDDSGSCINGFSVSIVTAPPQPPAYLYSIDGINFQQSPVFNQLQSSNYSVYILTGCGIQTIGSFNMTMNSLVIDATVSIGSNSTITGFVNVEGGTPPYVINWSTGATGTTATLTDFTQAIGITVTDSYGCKQYTELLPNGVGIENVELKPELQIYPNPASEVIAVKYTPSNDATEGTICIFNLWGQKIYCKYSSFKDIEFFQMKNLPDGLYFVLITTNRLQISSKIWHFN